MERKSKDPNLIQKGIQRGIQKISEAYHWYVETQATTKVGVALMTIALFTGAIGIAAGDLLGGAMCCNTIGLLSATSFGVSYMNNRVRRGK